MKKGLIVYKKEDQEKNQWFICRGSGCERHLCQARSG